MIENPVPRTAQKTGERMAFYRLTKLSRDNVSKTGIDTPEPVFLDRRLLLGGSSWARGSSSTTLSICS